MIKLLPYEVWRDIKGYEGMYQVSARGRVVGLKRKIKSKYNSFATVSGKLLKPSDNGKGYITYSLWKNNKGKHCQIHRLVAIMFIPNPFDKGDVNHIDGRKDNNNVSNLEWATRSENLQHAYNIGLKESNRNAARLTFSKKVINTKNNRIYRSATEAARDIGMPKSTLHCMLWGSRKNKTNLEYLNKTINK